MKILHLTNHDTKKTFYVNSDKIDVWYPSNLRDLAVTFIYVNENYYCVDETPEEIERLILE